MSNEKKKGYLVDAWLVLLLAVAFAAALAGVHISLKDRIAANQLNETLDRIPTLVPGADKGKGITIDEMLVYQAQDAQGKQVGWVIPAEGQGFADKIKVLIGLDLSGKKITGLYVLDQKETPGLGSKITDPDVFLNQFAGKKSSEKLTVVKGAATGNEIQSITGATISSDSVCNIVNVTLEKLAGKLKTETVSEEK